MEEYRVPEYLTPKQREKIRELIESGEIHPRNPACDFTLEVAVGVPIATAIKHLRRNPNDNSLYNMLYIQGKL